MSTFRKRAHDECTKNPIFLFQRRELLVIGEPEGFQLDADGDEFVNENGDVLSFKTCLEKEIEDEYRSQPVLLEEWVTEKVYLTREEAESAGNSGHYNYPHGWRVFCVNCYGFIVEAIELFEFCQINRLKPDQSNTEKSEVAA